MKRPFSVAIIDDDADLASNLQDILEENGYEVEVCPDASTALICFCEKSFHLGLVDIKLPDMPGLQLVGQLTQSYPQTEYLIITGYGSLESAIEAVAQRKIIGYEMKPLDLDRLLTLIEQIRLRQEANVRWQESESRLQLIMEQIPCIVWTMDRESRITYSSGAGLSALGLQPEELVGKTLSAYFESFQGEDGLSTITDAHRQALLGRPTTYEVDWVGRTLSCRIEPLTEATGEVVGVAGIAFDITEIARMQSQLRALTTRLVRAQEEERQRIASELHDQTGQSLTALRMTLDMCMRLPPEAVVDNLTEARTLVDELLAQMRTIMVRLHPPMLDDLGLLPTLLWDIDHFGARTGVTVHFKHSGLRRQIAPELKLAAYRIIQECLTNVARHAGVSEATLMVHADKNALFLTIEDTGNGFDPRTIDGNCSGLIGVMQRAEMVGGTVEIDTSPGSGTRVTVELPLRLQDAKTEKVERE